MNKLAILTVKSSIVAKKKSIHPSIKEKLGYDESISDKEFLKRWKRRSTQVCKPCWELKYCPYGPLVEQLPLLPTLKDDAIAHNEYLKHCLENNIMGGTRNLSKEEIESKEEYLEIIKKNPKTLLPLILKDINDEELINEGIEKDMSLFDLFENPYNNFEKYKLPFPLDEEEDNKRIEYFEKMEITPELQKRVQNKIETIERAIATGVEDYTKPLDPIRRKYFQNSIDEFDAETYPDYIPENVSEAACNVFGHVCPVFFVGESITETSEQRRRGRYISFKTKMRVVRRDNHTCQECSKHLKDDEVEFDHIIPVSKGGSSEEHNIRLTCYDCNRDKLDTVEI